MNSVFCRKRPAELCALLMLACAILFAGCSSSNPEDMIAAANNSNVKRLATLYTFFHQRNKNRGPKDEAEFKDFIAKQDQARLAKANVNFESLEELFVSERDGEPFVIRYKVNTRVRGPSLPVIFEKLGVDGQYQVGFTNGSMQEVDKVEYDQLMSGKSDGGRAADSAGRVN
ncbi:MAG: hypothetical protein AAFN77_12235 [Planctomycetota bacterium]